MTILSSLIDFKAKIRMQCAWTRFNGVFLVVRHNDPRMGVKTCLAQNPRVAVHSPSEISTSPSPLRLDCRRQAPLYRFGAGRLGAVGKGSSGWSRSFNNWLAVVSIGSGARRLNANRFCVSCVLMLEVVRNFGICQEAAG